MSDTIIVAIISGGVSLIGTVFTVIVTAQKQQQAFETRLAVIDERIGNLKESVEKHNGFGQRIPVLEEKISVANKRILDLETKTK